MDQRRVHQGRQVAELGAGLETGRQPGRQFQAQAGFPGPARAYHGHQSGGGDQFGEGGQLFMTADEAGAHLRQVVRDGRRSPQGRERGLEIRVGELVQPQRSVEVVHDVIAPRRQGGLWGQHVFEQPGGRGRDQDLAAVGGGGDAGCLVHR